jgi:amidase
VPRPPSRLPRLLSVAVTPELPDLSLLDVSDRIRRGEVSSEAVVGAVLQRIAEHEPRLHSILLLLADEALEDARRADAEIAAGRWRGPLHGVPVGIKDVLWTAGVPTTAGSELLKDFRPEADATVVRRLRQAGAVILAKLHTTEGAMIAHHPSLPRPVNPWSAPHWTGVSSSGSGVAVAAGFCYAALGSDTGGSIRLPSAANNLTGIKPTWGRVSRHGLMALSESLDHVGPMARTAADAAAVLQVIAGLDPEDPTSLPAPVPDYLEAAQAGVEGLVIGVDWAYATGGLPDPIVRAVREAAEVFTGLGAELRTVEFPAQDGAVETLMAILLAEAAAAHADRFPEHASRYGPELRSMLTAAAKLETQRLVRAYQARDRSTGLLLRLFEDVDVILTPGLGALVPTWEAIEADGTDLETVGGAATDLPRFTPPANLAGTPTISLPGGFTDDGLPVGLQLMGPRLGEPALIRAAAAFQRATGFHARRPPLDA